MTGHTSGALAVVVHILVAARFSRGLAHVAFARFAGEQLRSYGR